MSLDFDLRVHQGDFTLTATGTAARGQILAVLGPNGSGKSTLLGALAGHLAHVSGTIRVADRDIPLTTRPEQRRIGLLGQRATLFPHMTVLENVAFGPRAQRMHPKAARATARIWLDRVGLTDHVGRRPDRLSGGQQQRVALARALAARPDALLLDEPFAAMDAQTANQARMIVADLRDAARIPIILVTHDPVDAIVLSERTIVLHDGEVVQAGPTREVLGDPISPFIADLVGVNLLTDARASRGMARWSGASGVPITFTTPTPLPDDVTVSITFAPGAVRLTATDTPVGPNRWRGTVSSMVPLLGGIRVHTSEHPEIAIDLPSAVAAQHDVRLGSVLAVTVSPDDLAVRHSGASVDHSKGVSVDAPHLA